MDNEEKIKKMFNKKINKQMIYDKVVSGNKRSWFRYVMIGGCLGTIIMAVIFYGGGRELQGDDNGFGDRNHIIVNKFNGTLQAGNTSIAGGIYDIAGFMEDFSFDDLEYGDKLLKNIKIIKDYRVTFAKKYIYNELSGYMLTYVNDKEKKVIDIFMSLNMDMKPREISPEVKQAIFSNERSVIGNNNDVIILDTGMCYIDLSTNTDGDENIYEESKCYLSLFKEDDIYFDINTNVTMDELVLVLEDIIR